MHEELRSCN